MAEFVDVMPDREKVIRALECCLDINSSKYKHCLNCDYRHDIDHCQWACQTGGILDDALALLKEQEPVKPLDENYWKHTMGRCGHCKAPLPAIEGLRSKFCWMCGKPVKWE